MINYKDVDSQWLFNRSKLNKSNLFLFFLQLVFRLIKLPFNLLLITFSRSYFFKKQIVFSKTSKYSCLTYSGEKDREISAIRLFFYDFNIYDLCISRKFNFPDLKRILRILSISLQNNIYSIVKISEIVDYFQYGTDKEDFYLAIDGVTPINRAIASIFTSTGRDTIRFVLSSKGRHKDLKYTYNLAPEPIVDGKPNCDFNFINKKHVSQANSLDKNISTVIGIIGAPGPYRIFGIEYGLIPIL